MIYRQRVDNVAASALTKAAICGNIQAVSEAIANGIDINAIAYHGYAALHQACWMGQTSVIEILLQAGADPNLRPNNNPGFPPLMRALDNPPFKVEIFQMLIKAGANLNYKTNDDVNVLMMAIESENVEAIRLLIEAGVNVNARGYQGLTALKYLQQMTSVMPFDIYSEILKLLLAAGATE